jgi:hypothetical protein
MKKGERIHLNGWPDTQGTILKANKWGIVVIWDKGKTTRNDTQTLCRCTDRHCERA